MKTTAFFISFLALISLSSCKKNYTCECVKTSPSGTTSSESHGVGKMKLSDAKAKCDEGDETTNGIGGTTTTDCSIQS